MCIRDSLWGVPVAFGLLFGSRKIAAQNSEVTKKAALRVSDGIQEALENVREIRAANQEERYLAGLYEKIDQHEKVTIRGELTTGLFVNAASVIMRLGVATTILTGASLILSGQIDFMVLFCSCWSSPGCTPVSYTHLHREAGCEKTLALCAGDPGGCGVFRQ